MRPCSLWRRRLRPDAEADTPQPGPNLRRRFFELLADGRESYPLSHHLVSAFIIIAVATCAAAIMIVTMPGIDPAYEVWLDRVREATDVVFIIEYLLRIWVAPDYAGDLRIPARHMRLRYMRSVQGIFDLVVILPFIINSIYALPRDWYLVLEMLTLFKLARYAPGLALVASVLRREARALVAAFLALGVLLVLASCIMYTLEHDAQPELFVSIPHALWWGIVTMGTVGYGDMVPVTIMGKLFGGFVMLLGIAMFAIPAGLMASGFAEEIKRREFLVTWRAVAALPIFGHLNANSIAEIASLLKARVVPAGTMIVRKGDRAEAMYFVMMGEVEVDLKPQPVILGSGEHFGEIALLRHTRRTASVRALTECRLLSLGTAEFERLLEIHPDIREHMHSLANQRHSERNDAN